ncbi:MAG: Gfo/Idh/MocA family oxidoreductase [Clostridiales bacterium]|nr:Gfo/Idh/MocA family oxidoreductase [Clostridiales bacterium]
MKTIAVIGLGSRGTNYMRFVRILHKKQAKIVALCDINQVKVQEIGKKYKIDSANCFTDENEFFKEKRADAIFICTQDNDHYRHCMAALNLGYHILVEKPLSYDIDECLEIEKVAKEKNLYVVVCHVLRYSNYFSKMKDLVRNGGLGEIMTINHQENIANFHFAHSYVRGNWRKREIATPILMAKCCHDIDIISWLMEAEAEQVQSYGALSYFTKENAPKDAPYRCTDGCPVKDCPYNAEYLYVTAPLHKATWLKFSPRILTGKAHSTKKDVLDALKTGPYGVCVYRSDNDVFDHQSVLMKFPDNRVATHTLSAFTDKFYRKTHITLTNGEIIGDTLTGKLTVHRFNGKNKVYRTSFIQLPGHIEADAKIIKSFIALLNGTLQNLDDVTFVSATIPSHRTIVRAEESIKSWE